MELFISPCKNFCSVWHSQWFFASCLFWRENQNKQLCKKGFNKIIMLIVVRISCSSMLSIFKLSKVQNYINESMALPERNRNETVCVMYLIRLTVEFDEKNRFIFIEFLFWYVDCISEWARPLISQNVYTWYFW